MRPPERPGTGENRDNTIDQAPDTAERDEDDLLENEDDDDEPETSELDGDTEEDEDEGLASEEADDAELNLLIAMAELDAEAAEAYRIAAENTDQVHLRSQLEEFRSDHIRHVDALNGLIAQAGGPEVSTELDEESSAVTMLAASLGVMGLRAALSAMIANEQLTNTAYQAASELPFEEDVASLLAQHLADEQRHLDWLTAQEGRVRDDEANVSNDDI